MSEDRIHIEEQGAPSLLEEGQEPEASGPELGSLAVDGWTPEEASRLMASIYTTGVLIAFAGRKARLPRIEEWPLLAAQPTEFPSSGQALQPVLDRWLPKSAGGGLAALGMGVLAIAGEVGMATARRAPYLTKEDGRPAPTPSAAAASPGAPSPGPGEGAQDAGAGGGGFRFDAGAEEVLRRTPTHDTYSGMGMGPMA
jgi:hypothetical protein